MDAMTDRVFQNDGVTIHLGDCREVLKSLPDCSVNCCVTSPPYWGLRDYGHDDQLGQESTPEEFVSNIGAVFHEVRRVLTDDGTLWLNFGDTYAGSWGAMSYPGGSIAARRFGADNADNVARPVSSRLTGDLKAKDLVGIPWRVAFALQKMGWYLRQDIIWHKPNPMPESVRDRCTKSHEYIFLLSKSERYYFDHEAIQEPAVCFDEAKYAGTESGLESSTSHKGTGKSTRRFQKMRNVPGRRTGENANIHDSLNIGQNTARPMRNKRSVWTVATKPYPGAHFAVFPPELIEPCIAAGCPEGGTVLDPFTGSGTTAEVARRYGCKFIGCELNPNYLELAKARFDQSLLPFPVEAAQ